MQVESREYKVMLDHLRFADRKLALRELWFDLQGIVRRVEFTPKKEELQKQRLKKFDTLERRLICFLDTADRAFRKNDLILRQRRVVEKEEGRLELKSTEYTLKSRHADRYYVSGRKLKKGSDQKGNDDSKFEEDIGAPYRSLFTYSVTIQGKEKCPEKLQNAERLFPILGDLKINGIKCPGETSVEIVGNTRHHERIYKGPEFKLSEKVSATLAVILWSTEWKTRPTAAELSFRYGDKNEQYSGDVALNAYQLFAALQTLDWCQPDSPTKTQFAYGE
ncbi:hypothetical protein [Lacunimicrobium album]